MAGVESGGVAGGNGPPASAAFKLQRRRAGAVTLAVLMQSASDVPER